MMTDPNLYLKLGRLGSADKEKLLGCCIFASPFFPRHLSPPALSGGRGWGDCVAGRGSCIAGRGSCIARGRSCNPGRSGCQDRKTSYHPQKVSYKTLKGKVNNLERKR